MNAHVYPPALDVEDDSRAWLKTLAKYRQPRIRRSAFELLVTLVPFALFWAIACYSLLSEFWPGLIAILPASAFLLRLFMIQHDCGHGSFFARRKLDDWTGRLLGVLTLTPYDYWKRAHAAHHASAGNLDERGVGDITTLTVAEYRALSQWGRLGYRLYRHPLVMFGIGPAYLFLLKQRLPFGMMRSGAAPWISAMGTNAAILALAVAIIGTVGVAPFLLIHLPIVLLAGAAGIWLFYVQHQFEETHWSPGEDWEFPRAALHGASHYDLPPVLQWLTGYIGIHHVHHLASRIPFYRLPEVLRDHPELAGIGRITILDSLRCVKLVLWDEEREKLVSFRAAAQ
ncbi:Fatty acid desaturase [Pseudorhizobium banfieldiae]|uniref:Fatty acid desaturase n=1 Tax=Pseudorhizobium banfieldiae TaxID=1125847 RepID=L0NFT0_9HYPH|nr:fatty acid desaturase [Pseudorhizobium banfieldiae]CAD6610586.1 fatty acid desaturase [arsenite-oxidising bacterium NT-25]CCF19671.1 Fatty acid desaturase [Pseudorhizobium banfieldiae]